MCTAVFYRNQDAYFGRNLDLERGYQERVVITPRNYVFDLRCVKPMCQHYAMIGMAALVQGVPLYFEATNEKGLSMAGLNFPDHAVYAEFQTGKDNIAPFELIPWVLGQCSDLAEARELLSRMNLVNISFSEAYPLTPLHWMISDASGSLVVESVRQGLQVMDNPFEVLTNNPTFEYHQMNMNNYMGLSTGPLVNQFKQKTSFHNYSLGMGALGLPGDFSSASRFVRAFFVKEHSVAEKEEKSSVHQFFHILNAVAMPKGCVWTKNGYEYTRYSCCCNVNQGIYYYVTYDNFEIRSVHLHDVDLNQSDLFVDEVIGM